MKLTFRGHRIQFDSSRRDKHDGIYVIAVHIKMKKVTRGERFRSKTAFLTSVTFGG